MYQSWLPHRTLMSSEAFPSEHPVLTSSEVLPYLWILLPWAASRPAARGTGTAAPC